MDRSFYESFPHSPIRTTLGSLRDNAAAATAPNTCTQTHRKLDNTGYTFHGRSYGIGVSVGLVEAPQNGNLQKSTFLESGHMSNITCLYNHTMDFHVEQLPPGTDGSQFVWLAKGYISSGSFTGKAFPAKNDTEVVALLGHNPWWETAVEQNAIKYAQL